MGRIQAQTAKQVIIQKIREAESEVIHNEYIGKVGDLINGTVQRIEGGNVIVNLGRAEGTLPRQERIRGENYQPGERIKALIYEVFRSGQKVKILLTRASPDFVVKLFELEVPEISERIIEIKAIAREAGFRTKVAVSSYDMRVDCIGACVGIRGTRIKSITDELNDERIDIIRWNDSSEVLIINALRPAQIHSMTLDEETKTAHVLVPDDQLSLAIGRKGQNVRLATKLAGWDIKIQGLTEQVVGRKDSDEEEDPEVAAAREALLQGTSLEAIYSREKKTPAKAEDEEGAADADAETETGEADAETETADAETETGEADAETETGDADAEKESPVDPSSNENAAAAADADAETGVETEAGAETADEEEITKSE
jgi:N utilization substance protein A